MNPRLHGRVWLPVLLAALAVPALTARVPDVLEKSLFVSVVDSEGRPVQDVRMGDFLVREDGKDREVVAIKPASQPLAVAVLVDTAQGTRVTDAYGTPEDYVRDIRTAVGTFGKRLFARNPDVSVMLMEFGQAAIPITPFTSNPADFDKGVNKIVAKPGVGSVLLEAIAAANVELMKQKTTRRAIVTLNIEPSDEQSREEPKKIVESFRKSGAQLWSVSVQRGGLKNSKRDLVINDFAKATGGQRDFLVGISAVGPVLEKYADALTTQWEIVYKRPESSKPPKEVLLGTILQNVKTHASGFPPE